MSSVAIATMGLRHLPSVLRIEQACFTPPWSEESFIETLSSPHALCLVSLKGTLVTGFLCIRQTGDEAEVLKLAVDSLHRREHAARTLLQQGMETLRSNDCDRVFLEVRDTNEAAITLYQAMGFSQVGMRKAYYPSSLPAGKDEDALVMEKKLNIQ